MGYAISVRQSILNTYFVGVATDLALLTTNPSDETGTGLAEVSTGTWTNYARQTLAATTGWTAPSGTSAPQTCSNAAKVDFGTATISGTAPVITGVAFYQSGTFKGWQALSSNQTINNGDPVYFNAGQFVVQL